MQKEEGDNIDRELLSSFREQLTEGKTFSEGFLRCIIETPFAIKDRDSKIEKILGIIGDIDSQIKIIDALVPRPSTTTTPKRYPETPT